LRAPGDRSTGTPDQSAAEDQGERSHGLRQLSLGGGAYLLGRESTGIIIRLAGVLLVTRIIGPYNYGLYASAAAFVALLASLAQLGVEIGLISSSEAPSDRAYDTAFTLLLLNSGIAVIVGLLVAMLISALTHPPPYLAAFEVLLISIPLNICWAPAQARIERRFHYRRMAYLELGGDVVLYGTSIPLALAGTGVWAPTIGFVVWQGVLFVGSLIAAGTVPRLAWDRHEVRRMLHFGGGFGLTTCIMNVAGLVNPLVVGHYVGPSGVGYVAVAQRLVSTVGFVNRAVWRLALVALGRVQDDLARLRRGMEEAMALQVVALGPLLVGFAIISSIAVPLLLSRKWESVIDLYPYLAFGDLVMTVGLVPQAVLYAKKKNMAVVLKQLANLIIIAVVSVILVPVIGIQGFGIAWTLSVASLLIVHIGARRILYFGYSRTWPWLVAFCPPLFFQLVAWPWRVLLLLPLALIGIVPRMRKDLAEYTRTAWSSIRKQP
jgi:O-antigen/teichoic acid export membrane protein